MKQCMRICCLSALALIVPARPSLAQPRQESEGQLLQPDNVLLRIPGARFDSWELAETREHGCFFAYGLEIEFCGNLAVLAVRVGRPRDLAPGSTIYVPFVRGGLASVLPERSPAPGRGGYQTVQADLSEIKTAGWLGETIKSVSPGQIVLTSGVAPQLDPFLIVDRSKRKPRLELPARGVPAASIYGVVTCVRQKREAHEELPNYEVYVFLPDEKTVVTRARTDHDGRYRVELAEGEYLLWPTKLRAKFFPWEHSSEVRPIKIVRGVDVEWGMQICNSNLKCLTAGTQIATPEGHTPVEHLKPGDSVWTQDAAGDRQVGVVRSIVATPVTCGKLLHLVLSDGRTIVVSPQHPLSNGRPASDLSSSELLDGATVQTNEYVEGCPDFTYDLLPSGQTGIYWANGIPLGSTLVSTSNPIIDLH